MGAGYHGGFGNTTGAGGDKPKPVPKKKAPIFDDKGHVTILVDHFLEDHITSESVLSKREVTTIDVSRVLPYLAHEDYRQHCAQPG